MTRRANSTQVKCVLQAKGSAVSGNVEYRPNRSLTADYARLSRFLLKNADGNSVRNWLQI